MSTRRDIAVALKHSVMLNKASMKLLDTAAAVHVYKQDRLYLFEYVVWDPAYQESIRMLYEDITQYPAADYRIVTACSEFPESDVGDIGEWDCNPWSIARNVEVTVHLEMPVVKTTYSSYYDQRPHIHRYAIDAHSTTIDAAWVHKEVKLLQSPKDDVTCDRRALQADRAHTDNTARKAAAQKWQPRRPRAGRKSHR